MSEQRWLPIESNPSVMNQFLHKLGMPKIWAMTDVFGLDDELLMMIPQPVCALLLLFPINQKVISVSYFVLNIMILYITFCFIV